MKDFWALVAMIAGVSSTSVTSLSVAAGALHAGAGPIVTVIAGILIYAAGLIVRTRSSNAQAAAAALTTGGLEPPPALK